MATKCDKSHLVSQFGQFDSSTSSSSDSEQGIVAAKEEHLPPSQRPSTISKAKTKQSNAKVFARRAREGRARKKAEEEEAAKKEKTGDGKDEKDEKDKTDENTVVEAAYHEDDGDGDGDGDESYDDGKGHAMQNFALPGMIPVVMLKDPQDSSDGQTERAKADAELEAECPFERTTTVTVTTDPVLKVKWGPETSVLASGEAMAIAEKMRQKLREKKKKAQKDQSWKGIKTKIEIKGSGKGEKKIGERHGDGTRKEHKTDEAAAVHESQDPREGAAETKDGSHDGKGKGDNDETDDETLLTLKGLPPMPPPGTPHNEP